MIERMMQYFKDRTESFDDYYPCIKNKRETVMSNMHTIGSSYLFRYIKKNTILFKIEGEIVLN